MICEVLISRAKTPTTAPWTPHRRKYLLSGLLDCGVCGGGFAIVNAHDDGCAALLSTGTNRMRIWREEPECLSKMLLRCRSIVFSLRHSSAAITLFCLPVATSRST
jgi:hypothetical protein